MTSSSSNTPFYKCLIVGDAGTGKTAFIKRHRIGEFEVKYIATMGVEVNPLPFTTSLGPVGFNVWDCAGQEKFSALGDGYYIGAQCAIIFFADRLSYKSVPKYIADIRRICGNIPIIVCENKHDIKKSKMLPTSDDFLVWNVSGYQVSAKSHYNHEEPFLDLLRQLTGDNKLAFVEAEAVTSGSGLV